MDNKAEYTIADRGATEAKVRVTVPPEEVRSRIESIFAVRTGYVPLRGAGGA